ncbi:MAG: type II secretion system protein [Candidatus Aureabacteria bacterium]|nr:type II secretion system protein [Candidatus Auribacterota bacterium]
MKYKRKKTDYYKKGYTLVEVTMSIMLMGIIASIFVSTIVEGARTYVFIESQAEAANTAKFSLKRILRDCRNATVISSADSTSITFTNAFSEDMQFVLSGNVLNISDDNGTNFYPLAENVQSLSFSYYDNLNNSLATPVADPSEIMSISIELKTQKNNISFPVKGKIYLRIKPK